MGLQDRDYMKKKPSNGGKTVKNENEKLNQRQKDVLRKMENQLNEKKRPRDMYLIALVLIGGGLIIYGLLTHPERLLPIAVENSSPIRSF